MNKNKIQLKILKLLLAQNRKCASYVKKDFITKNIDEISHENLLTHLNYLNKNRFIHIKQIYDDSIIIETFMISNKGIELIKSLDM